MTVEIITGDCRDVLRSFPDGSVHCCVTSPPYFGLRDYGVDGQIGLEQTPDEYVAEMVAVFRDVRRVLRDDGTLWLNLGDSYAGAGYSNHSNTGGAQRESGGKQRHLTGSGLKNKDLIGIPWSVAKALQAPFYTGRIKSELDRVWLAATIDAEGSICGFTHERKDDGTIRTGIHLTITNTNRPLLDNAFRIWPTSREDHNFHGEGHLGSADTYRWIAHNVDDKAELLREIYPYLIAKKKQALLAWNFLEMSREAKRLARTGEAEAVKEKRAWIVAALSRLNHFEDVDVPAWCREPPSMFEPGWYLRQDLIWHKPNPMPESVKDRCTKAHEYIFMLSKSARYYYDIDAIKEPVLESSLARIRQANFANQKGGEKDYQHTGQNANRSMRKTLENFAASAKKQDGHGRRHAGFNERFFAQEEGKPTRNRRSVWTVSTKPFKGAHFATFPPDLIEPCILAGCPPQGTVLDPFGGAGTTGLVADRLHRNAVLIELNSEYADMAQRRIDGDAPLFARGAS